MIGIDPVQVGVVASFNRPGGNLTGVVSMGTELGAKRLGLLHELAPRATRFGALINSVQGASADATIADLTSAASAIGREIEIINIHTPGEIDSAFESLLQRRIEALVVSAGPLFLNRTVQLVTLATYHRLPAIYPNREITEAGGLMSYGASNADLYRQIGLYAGRILKGEKPADLPIMRATRFEFVINLQTAKTTGTTFPPGLLAIADEVIE